MYSVQCTLYAEQSIPIHLYTLCADHPASTSDISVFDCRSNFSHPYPLSLSLSISMTHPIRWLIFLYKQSFKIYLPVSPYLCVNVYVRVCVRVCVYVRLFIAVRLKSRYSHNPPLHTPTNPVIPYSPLQTTLSTPTHSYSPLPNPTYIYKSRYPLPPPTYSYSPLPTPTYPIYTRRHIDQLCATLCKEYLRCRLRWAEEYYHVKIMWRERDAERWRDGDMKRERWRYGERERCIEIER